MKTVGIPGALLYYQYFPMWKTFFQHLGAEVVVSGPTTRTTLAGGTARVVADTCLPVKVFVGHVLSLVDRCDCIFIPAIRSLRTRSYNCSKFLGLPDMTRAVVPEAPPILEIEVDVNRGRRRLYQAIYGLGRRISWNPLRVKEAANAAWQAYQDYRAMMCGQRLTPLQVLEHPQAKPGPAPVPYAPTGVADLSIAVVGHPYLLYDEHVNYHLIRRLEQYGARVLTPEMLGEEEQRAAIARLVGRSYWTYEGDVVGAGGAYLQAQTDGVIGVMAFGCGPDSLMMEILHREANRQRTTPFMCITLEEHTSETGVITRLEAFLDMIARRKRRQTPVCV